MDQSESLDLSQLHLTPDWVKQAPETNKYADYKGDDREGRSGRGRRDGRGDFGGGGRPPRRDDRGGGGGGKKPAGERRNDGPPRGRAPGTGPGKPGGPGKGGADRRSDQGQQRQGQRPGGNRDDRRGGGRGNFRGRGRDDRDRHREPLPAGIEVRFIAGPAGIESLARQIKATGRAYSVFDLAKLVLSARERYAVEFVRTKEAAEGMRFYQCKLDNSLWLSKEDALRHALTADGLSDYYVSEEVETEGPKGNFTVIAVCGMSGVLLGPPNHHDYQRDLTRLHQERFANMHIEGFKRRIRMEKDEETIEKWKAEKSKQTHYTYQKTPEGAEPVVLKSTAEMERHCRENHLDDFVAAVDSAKLPGNIPAKALAPGLLAVLRNELEQQKRFPMNTVKVLCRQLEDQGLKFFKDEDGKKKKTTYVCRSRPRALQGASGLSDRIRKIVGLVRDNPGIDYTIVVSSMLPGERIAAATSNAGKKPAAPKAEAKKPDAAKAPAAIAATPEAPANVEKTPEAESAPAQPKPDAPVEAVAPAAAAKTAESTTVPTAEAAPATRTTDDAVPTSEEVTQSAPTQAESPPAAESESAPEPVVPAEASDASTATPESTTESKDHNATAATAATEPVAPAEASTACSTPTPESTAESKEGSAPAPAAAAAAPEVEGPSEEEIGILKDLRWLIREGYVVEYSSGAMRLARNAPPRKRPAKKKKAPAQAQAAPKAAASAPAKGVPTAPSAPSAPATAAAADSAPPKPEESATAAPAPPKAEVPSPPPASTPVPPAAPAEPAPAPETDPPPQDYSAATNADATTPPVAEPSAEHDAKTETPSATESPVPEPSAPPAQATPTRSPAADSQPEPPSLASEPPPAPTPEPRVPPARTPANGSQPKPESGAAALAPTSTPPAPTGDPQPDAESVEDPKADETPS